MIKPHVRNRLEHLAKLIDRYEVEHECTLGMHNTVTADPWLVWALVSEYDYTGRHWITLHSSSEAASTQALGEEDGRWRPVELYHLVDGTRLEPRHTITWYDPTRPGFGPGFGKAPAGTGVQ